MTAPARTGRRRWGPWLWLALVLLVAVHQVQVWREGRLQTDLFALLPHDDREPDAERASRQLTEGAARQLVVLVGAADAGTAALAAERFDAAWRKAAPALREAPLAAPDDIERTLRALQPWRGHLLDATERERLRNTPAAELADQALATLFQPGLSASPEAWRADPLGLAPAWWLARLASQPLRPRDGRLVLEAEGRHWVMLAREVPGEVFSFSGERPLAAALEQAGQAARDAAGGAAGSELQFLQAGVPLLAEAAAARGATEVNVIGWGSLAAVLLLVWAGFRSLRPIVCVALSLVVGLAVALSATVWVFGEIHLITVIFGASLVGVAEDFGIHFFASRAAEPATPPATLLARLGPGLRLALATSVLGYAVMALVPFPGLRQMALFASVGLVAAFLTVWFWFPALCGPARAMTPLAERVAGSLRWRPAWPRSLGGRVLWAVAAVLVLAGLLKLQLRDDLRALQAVPPDLLVQQQQVQRLLQLPEPGSFFLVSAADEAELLRRERALLAALAPLREAGVLGGWQAVSDWVPPPDVQQADAALAARAEDALRPLLAQRLGQAWPVAPRAAVPLTVEDWLAQPGTGPQRSLWLGRGADGGLVSVVRVSGVSGLAQLPRLAAAAEGLPGVSWVDRVGRVGELLARYRQAMSGLLALGFVVVGLALLRRFGADAWRAWLPSLLACLVCLGVLGWLGLPLQLFNVLALIILLGVGVDYGIFLVEHRGDGSAWLAVVLGATSTLLSFGLLALSSTPALRDFGLTMAIGLLAVVALSTVFLPTAAGRTGGTAAH